LHSLPIKLSDATGVPYYRQIVDQVAQLIRSGQLEQGAQLPSVRELSSDLLVSLITTRRAYADLEGLGLIIRRQGSGTFVAEEVEVATREQATADIRIRLQDAVDLARRLGLADRDLEQILTQVLSREEGSDGVR
jgi:GntR family transcriptional regulator